MVGNLRFFFRALCKEEPAQRENSSNGRWADIWAILINNGHQAKHIEKYTYRQVMLYFEAALRREQTIRAQLIVDMNVAQAGGKAAKKYIAKILEN